MTAQFKLAAALILSGLILAGCQKPAEKADAPAAPAAQPVASVDVYPFAIGTLQGHTAGHTGYEIVSGQDRLLYLGDALHSSIISVERPEYVNQWDFESDAAIATRLAVLGRGATQSLRVYGVHVPYPGLGKFQRRADGFIWVPETPAQP